MMTLTEEDFKTLVNFVHNNYGINLANKKVLIEGRLTNVLRDRGFASFHDYLQTLFNDKSGNEINLLLNKLTTNHTYFMREEEHFSYLKEVVLPYFEATCKSKDLRVWSAGCSSGQEAYTIAMTIDEYFGNNKHLWDTTILATDISMDILGKAQQATYPADALDNVPEAWRKKYFKQNQNGTVTVCDKIRNEVVFKPFNLMAPFTFRKSFDIIFCRNVMIYFDAPTKDELVNKFYDFTNPNGYLFIGHSETVNKSNTKYTYIRPAIYRKESK